MNALKVDTEKKIIEAAKEVFQEKGLQGARMQEIADKAGINKALLHYYFRSKERMFDAVFDDTVKQLIPEFSKILDLKKPIPELMKDFIDFYNGFFMKNPFMPQFFFHEIWQHPEKLAGIINSQKVQPKEMADRLSNNLPEVEGTDYIAQHVIASILGMTLFPHIARPLFQRIMFENDDEKYQVFLEERTDVLVKMISGFMSENSDLSEDPKDDF